MGLGFQELLVILGIIVLLFGATRLPQLGKGLGQGIANFKRGLKGGDRELGPADDEGEDETSRPD
jgi:sec-independent protein translocase protein TatA